MRQEIGRLVHQIDAQFVVGQPDMDMQAADREPPHDALQVILQIGIAAALGGFLRVPAGKGMGCGGYRRHAVAGRDRGDSPAEMAQVGARFGEAGAHAGADLDLRT